MIDILFVLVAVSLVCSLAGLMFMCLYPLVVALNEWLGD